jgi:hypothetical protein
MTQDSTSAEGFHDPNVPPMRIIGSDETGLSMARQAYLRAMRSGVAETREQGGEPDYDVLAEVASDIAQEAYDNFAGR